MGETLRVGTHLYIESELNLIKETRRELRDDGSTEKDERKVMKKLGLKRSDIGNFTKRKTNNILKHSYSFLPSMHLSHAYAPMNEGHETLGGQTPMSSLRQWGRCC